MLAGDRARETKTRGRRRQLRVKKLGRLITAIKSCRFDAADADHSDPALDSPLAADQFEDSAGDRSPGY